MMHTSRTRGTIIIAGLAKIGDDSISDRERDKK
jgi:hypothetical protein